MSKAPETVKGHDLPAPRLTPAGWRLLALWLLPGALGIIAVADIAGWIVARALWGTCLGLVCLLG